MHPSNASSHMTQIDQYLLNLALDGDADSFGMLMERWRNRIFGFIFRYIGDREDASDLTQETFTKAYQNLNRLTDPASFSAWIYKIALNECRMRFRRNARSKLVSLDKAQTIPEAAVMDESTPEKLFYRSELQRVFSRSVYKTALETTCSDCNERIPRS